MIQISIERIPRLSRRVVAEFVLTHDLNFPPRNVPEGIPACYRCHSNSILDPLEVVRGAVLCGTCRRLLHLGFALGG
jgi:hypothetical protein